MGIIAAFFQAFFDIIFQRASLKPFGKESLVDDVLERITSIFKIICFIFIAVIVILSTPDKNRISFIEGLNHQGWWWLLILFIALCIIMLFISIFYFMYNLKKYKIGLSDEKDLIRFKDTEIVGRLIEMEKRIGIGYTDSFKFFQKLIKKYNQSNSYTALKSQNENNNSFSKPYVEFIKDFKTHTDLPLADLNTIFTYASNSSSSIFKCVIAFDEYFEDDPNTAKNEILGMLRYFCCFKKGAEKNHINRIFTLPGIPVAATHIGKTKTIFNTPLTKKKNAIILKYLITNKICSVDTYLLVYDNENSDVKEEFFVLADYVIAISANQSNKKENRIFFAYPKEQGTNERTISTIDPFIIALMDSDYEYRLTKLGDSDHLFNIEELKRANKEEIYSMLHFDTNTKEGKQEVNDVIDDLEKQLIEIVDECSIRNFHSTQQIKDLLSGYKYQ